ncbi:hypothetical protein [Maricaulis sp.]|uniref:hypothetical protein n=1 Tax=Maricaulis sp. TaxID=1486257 RepID=UPI003A8CD86E
MAKRSDPAGLTLQELSRALAAHAVLTSNPSAGRDFFAPELFEQTASFIHRFALGETPDRVKQSDG